MKIRYLGHSCFLLTESTGTRILTDPYGDVGFKMPRVEADVVSVSHGHYDHNNVKGVGGNPVVLDKEGQYEVGGVEIIAVKSYHDNANGAERGENLIFKFRLDGIEVCHLGDLGEECSSSLIEMLLPVHVLLIPVGGKYTIDAEQAKEYVDRIMPSIVIPMHYKSKGLSLDIDKPDAFLSEFEEEDVEELDASEIELTRDDIDEETTRVILMERSNMPEKTLEEEYREYLSTLSIQTLRTLGRKLGIPAECRKTKPSCVNGLLDLLMGRADPVPVSGKGAPVKQNYLDPSIIRRLEEMRLVRERQIERPVTTMTVSSGKKETSFYDAPSLYGDIGDDVGRIRLFTRKKLPTDERMRCLYRSAAHSFEQTARRRSGRLYGKAFRKRGGCRLPGTFKRQRHPLRRP